MPVLTKKIFVTIEQDNASQIFENLYLCIYHYRDINVILKDKRNNFVAVGRGRYSSETRG